jgi:uncharacterized Zn-finger protein
VSNNTNNENMTTNTKEDLVAPSENPEDRPDLRDYKSKQESPNKVEGSSNSCKYCNKKFSNMEELTAHYRKEHPESV